MRLLGLLPCNKIRPFKGIGPGSKHLNATLLGQLVRFVQSVRETDIRKRPSIAETVDWARTLLLLHASSLDEDFVRDTLNVLLKHESDIAVISPSIPKLVREATGPDARGRLASGYPDMG